MGHTERWTALPGTHNKSHRLRWQQGVDPYFTLALLARLKQAHCKQLCARNGCQCDPNAKGAHPIAEGDEAPAAFAARRRRGVAALGRRCAVARCAGHDVSDAALAMPCAGMRNPIRAPGLGTSCACDLATSAARHEDTTGSNVQSWARCSAGWRVVTLLRSFTQVLVLNKHGGYAMTR